MSCELRGVLVFLARSRSALIGESMSVGYIDRRGAAGGGAHDLGHMVALCSLLGAAAAPTPVLHPPKLRLHPLSAACRRTAAVCCTQLLCEHTASIFITRRRRNTSSRHVSRPVRCVSHSSPYFICCSFSAGTRQRLSGC